MATLGKTDVGGDSFEYTANIKAVCGPYSFAGGVISKATIYLAGSPTEAANWKAIIYSNAAGSPSALLATSSAVAISQSQAAGWVDFDFSPDVTLSAQNIHFGMITGGKAVIYYLGSGASVNQSYDETESYAGGPADPYGTFATGSGVEHSMYVTWSAAASPPVADFSATPLSGSSPLSVAFTYSGSGGTPDTYHWEKNDGSGWVDFAGSPTSANPTENFS